MPSRSQAAITLASRAAQAGLIAPSGVKPPIFHGWFHEYPCGLPPCRLRQTASRPCAR